MPELHRRVPDVGVTSLGPPFVATSWGFSSNSQTETDPVRGRSIRASCEAPLTRASSRSSRATATARKIFPKPLPAARRRDLTTIADFQCVETLDLGRHGDLGVLTVRLFERDHAVDCDFRT